MAHSHYNGTGKVHSFRGLLVDGGQDKIRIEGATGDIAWRITKFQGLPEKPFTQDLEAVLKIYREEQTSIDGEIDFRNDELLAALTQKWLAGASDGGVAATTIFDNALFSRNIYVTHSDVTSDRTYNYYIELEEVKLSQTGMAQLAVAAARRT